MKLKMRIEEKKNRYVCWSFFRAWLGLFLGVDGVDGVVGLVGWLVGCLLGRYGWMIGC